MNLGKIPKPLWVTIIGLIIPCLCIGMAIRSIAILVVFLVMTVLVSVLIFGLISGHKWAFWGMIILLICEWEGGLKNGTFNWHSELPYTALRLIPLLFSFRFFYKPTTPPPNQSNK
jgi:hypothetical protein